MAELTPRMPELGETVLGRYRIESILGKGGMGVVFGARRIPGDERVALKVMSLEAFGSPEAGPRFLNEARTALRLTSPHVAKVFEVAALDGGLPLMAMELLEGSDLGARIDPERPLPVQEAVGYVLEAIRALGEAHALGIVHRDLKPSNLFVARTANGPMVKVLDFGVSKILGPVQGPQAALTSTGSFLGSPAYVAPEQLRNAKDVDRRADIWSLGVILYELTTGKLPFDSGSMGELFMAILSGDHPPPRQHRPDLPLAFEIVIERCLAKKRDDRFADVGELARALEQFAAPAAPPPSNRQLFGGTMLMANRPPGLDAPRSERLGAAPPASDPRTWAAPPAAPSSDSRLHASTATIPGRPAGPAGVGAAPTRARAAPWLPIVIVGAVVLALIGGALIVRATMHRAPPPATTR